MGATIAFYVLSAIILTSAILAVTSRKMMRAATYLLFVLLGTAGLYLLLNYHFLFAVQLSVYAGGILVLFIFAILLTSANGDKTEPSDKRKVITGILASLAGIAVTLFVVLKNKFLYADSSTLLGDQQVTMKEIGLALTGTEKYQYMLPFEVLGILLLTCAIGGILIARKR